MTSPTPFNDTTRDEMFDRGLEKLLGGDMTGLDDIDPDLRDTVLEMVGLANTAGWIGAEPGPPLQDTRPFLVRWGPVFSKVAAVLLVVLLGATGYLGWLVIEQRSDSPDASPSSVGIQAAPTAMVDFPYISESQAAVGSGTCGREPRSDAEIARIAREPMGPWRSREGTQQSHNEINANVTQVTRDWTACLVEGDFARAMAYESENFIRSMMNGFGVDDLDNLSDEEIAGIVIGQHRLLIPMARGKDIEIVIYRTNYSSSGSGTTQIENWMVPVDPKGDWVEWPTVNTFVWEGDQWMIQLTDREGSPATPVPEPER